MEKKRNRVWIFGLIVLADLLLSWVVFYICDMWLTDILGPDIIEYETWFGDIEDTVVYRFGTCSAELLFALLQAILFVCIEVVLYKRKKISMAYTRIVIILHALNFFVWGLFYVDWNAYIRVPEFLLPQYIVLGIMRVMGV